MSEFSYSSLVKKYQNFMSPAMKITIDGKTVTEKSGIRISQAEVQMSVEDTCTARFTIEDAYDLEQRTFKSQVKNDIQLGSVVSIEMGYGSSLKNVFWGYVHELNYSYSSAPVITATALDMRRLMMMNHENRVFNDMSYSDIFNEIIKKYDKVYESASVEPLKEKIPRMIQECSDYDFVINELCPRANKDFYVLAGTVYFQEKTKNPTDLITFTWGENLMSFNISRMFMNEEISVYGVDEKKMVVGRESVQTKGKVKSVTTGALKSQSLDTHIKDQKAAAEAAKKEAKKRKKKSKYGSGSCIGLPELVPGRQIRISRLDVDGETDLQGYINSVSHSFGEDGFTTDFELGG